MENANRRDAAARSTGQAKRRPEARGKEGPFHSSAGGRVLVFGHTHRPFLNKAENLANTGSWVTTALIHNTFVRLEGGKPKLFVFEGAEITERADI